MNSNARLFPCHSIRTVQSLDGDWSLELPPQDETILDPQNGGAGRQFNYPVPSVWEKIPELITYRGQAVASRRFSLDKAARVQVVFRGVSHTARVFVDGREIGGHHNAFTPFALDAGRLEAGEHELRVHISNEHGEISALHIPNDYYNYGGITRPVELHVFRSDLAIRHVHFTPSRTNGEWGGRLVATLDNWGEPVRGSLEVELAGQTVRFDEVELGGGETTVSQEADFPNVEPWSPDHPKLYRLAARLSVGGDVVDDWADRTGFRTVETRGEQILLNGEPVFLMGFNRHEDHIDHGCALPLSAIRADVELLLDLGSNAVRTSHYPNDERFLDLCDETGIMVWEENHARGLTVEHMEHPRFREQCRACNEEMIAWHFNHPSIVIWGILNECASWNEKGREMYAEQFTQIKTLDPSRPTTFASCAHNNDICLDLPDICSWNWYFNWYCQWDINVPVVDPMRKALAKSDVSGGAGKPCIASEFGGGAIPGYYDPVRMAHWSEERQAAILEKCLEAYLNEPRLTGTFIWQFCDIRVDPFWAMKRPRTMNNKGVVNERRKPKLSYEVVQRMHRAKDAVKSRGEALPVDWIMEQNISR